MPLSPARNKPKTSASKTRNSRCDVRHIGSSVVPDTRCKGVQVSPLTLEENKIPKTHLKNEHNFSRQIAINNQENFSNNYNKDRSVVETVNFDQPIKYHSQNFFNEHDDTLNACCRSKKIDLDENSKVNSTSQANTYKSDLYRPKNDIIPQKKHGTYYKDRFTRQPSETFESGTIMSTGTSRGHINIYRNPIEYRSSQRLIESNSREIPSNIIDESQEFTNIRNLNRTANQSSKLNFNSKSCCQGQDDPQNMNKHQPNTNILKNKGSTRDAGLDEVPMSLKNKPKAIQTQYTEKKRAQVPELWSKYASENNKSVLSPHRIDISYDKQREQNLFDETVSTTSRPGKGCCSDSVSGSKTNFRAMPKSSITNVDCACASKNDIFYSGYDKLCTKKTCDREAGTISCASASCTANQGSKCRCRYPPFFKQYSCAGNINGCCNCND